MMGVWSGCEIVVDDKQYTMDDIVRSIKKTMREWDKAEKDWIALLERQRKLWGAP